MYDYGYSYGYGLIGGNTYNPLINYDWSTTTAKEYKTDGVELVINGGFDTDSDWSKQANWSIINSKAIADNTGNIYQTINIENNSTYLLSLDSTILSIQIRIGGINMGYYSAGVGIKKEFTSNGNGVLEIICNDSRGGEIDNISVQKVIQSPNKRYLKDVGSTPTYNASMYFGRGAYFNGVDQTITVPINTTIQTALKRVNGVVTISETSQTLTNYVISGLGVHKDYYLFTRLLTPSEKDSYTNTPELFYAMAQADNTCVLNMPMCETSSTVRNYKTGIDYPISNYTTSVRDNAKKLQYGLQTCKFVRDSLGVIQGASDYLECDGSGYGNTGWIPSADEDWTLELVQNISSNTTFQISGTTVSGDSRFFIGSDATGKVVANLGGVSKYSLVQLGNRHIVLSYEASTKQYILYLNGVPLGITSTPSFVTGSVNFTLGNVQLSFEVATEIRLFKVHPKALTQDEVTKAYTYAVNKGLLV